MMPKSCIYLYYNKDTASNRDSFVPLHYPQVTHVHRGLQGLGGRNTLFPEGFPFMIGGLGVGLCLPAMALRPLPFTAVRGIALIPCRWAARAKCDKNDLLEWDFRASTRFLWRFVTCVAMMFARCVAGAILWKPFNVTVSLSRAGAALCAYAVYNLAVGAAFCDMVQRLF